MTGPNPGPRPPESTTTGARADSAPPIPPTATTQARHPVRASVRTGVATAVGAIVSTLLVLPEIDKVVPLGKTWPWLGGIVVFAGIVTRVMAIPAVERLLRRYRLTAWLSAAPRRED